MKIIKQENFIIKWAVKDHPLYTRVYTNDEALQSTVRLTVCTDYRFLEIGNVMNLMLKTVTSVKDFFVFAYRWDVRKAQDDLKSNLVLRQYLERLVSLLEEHRDVYGRTTIYVWNKGLSVHLPNRDYLKYANAEVVIDQIKGSSI